MSCESCLKKELKHVFSSFYSGKHFSRSFKLWMSFNIVPALFALLDLIWKVGVAWRWKRGSLRRTDITGRLCVGSCKMCAYYRNKHNTHFIICGGFSTCWHFKSIRVFQNSWFNFIFLLQKSRACRFLFPGTANTCSSLLSQAQGKGKWRLGVNRAVYSGDFQETTCSCWKDVLKAYFASEYSPQQLKVGPAEL